MAAGPDTEAQGEEAGEVPQVFDGLPLIKAATDLKEEGNACVKSKNFNDAVSLYERGINILDKADGKPMLRQEVEEMVALKSVLYSNVAQCMLHLELFRRAAEAATECLKLDNGNVKALLRRSLAYENLRKYREALDDAVVLQSKGGGSLTAGEVGSMVERLRGKREAGDRALEEESSEDEGGTALVRMKERFDEVVEKYDFKGGEAAAELADWITSGEWTITARRVAQRWHMEEGDAEVFLEWIQEGLEFKAQNAEAAGQAQAAAPAIAG